MTTFVALELPHVHGDVAGQLARLDEALTHIEHGAVVCLPELALTGYVSPRGDFNMARLADDGSLAEALAARATHHTLVAGLVEKDGTHLYNTTLVLGAQRAKYRKRHPWYPETWATPGENEHPLLDFSGVKATIAVCFDVHFLRDEADHVLREAEVLIFPSAWVEDEIDSRDTLLPALAKDYDLTVVNPNWGPGDPLVRTQGKSRIVTATETQIGVITSCRR